MNTKIELNDFYSAAYLIAAGVELKEIYRVGSQSTFVFESSEIAKNLLGGYYAMDAMVNASAFVQEIKKLKTIIHQNINLKSEVKLNEERRNILNISQG